MCVCVCNVCTIYRYQLPCIYIVHGNFTSQFQRTNQSQISNNGMVQLLTTAGTPRERPFKRNKCHRPKSFIQKYRPCKVESLNTRFKSVTLLLRIGSYNLDLTGAQKLRGAIFSFAHWGVYFNMGPLGLKNWDASEVALINSQEYLRH